MINSILFYSTLFNLPFFPYIPTSSLLFSLYFGYITINTSIQILHLEVSDFLSFFLLQMLFGRRPFGEGKSQEKVLSEGIILNATQVSHDDMLCHDNLPCNILSCNTTCHAITKCDCGGILHSHHFISIPHTRLFQSHTQNENNRVILLNLNLHYCEL